ncbi:MAG TPA: hypothetical protein VE263_01960 [Candidatus Angelobacter sp.]|nr:hypothetical protein [Candidatus Angelobacter sp.]
MKRISAFALASLACFLFFAGWATARAQTGGREKPLKVEINSYEIVQLELKTPVRLRDAEGKEQSYERAYLVTLKGTFPRDGGLGMELYIGDYRVPEYGGTRDGLYFRIYGEKLLDSLEGKEFRYRFGPTEIRSFEKRFSTKEARPFKSQRER